MTEVSRRELFPGVWLRTVHTNKFKSAYLSVTLLAPLEPETAAANALIPSVLRRGTAAHPDMESLSAALDELYGGAIEPAVRRKGETQCVGFVASFLDDAYALNGEKILESAAALLGELLLRPYTQDGIFCPDYTAGERANLIDRIRGQINDKRSYATHRLIQLMCGEEAFGTDKLGDETTAAAITPASLWQRYQELLRTAAVEVYYCGSAQPERVEAALSSALSGLPVNEARVVPDCEVRIHAGTQPRVWFAKEILLHDAEARRRTAHPCRQCLQRQLLLRRHVSIIRFPSRFTLNCFFSVSVKPEREMFSTWSK